MDVFTNHSLKPFNSFHIEALAKRFVQPRSLEDVRSVVLQDDIKTDRKLVLGGGSNILLTQDFDGTVIKVELEGRELVREDDDHVWVKVGAGENWHQFVLWCIDNNYAGVENLSLIPGNVGAAPMQNIGAYGMEIRQVFEELEAVSVDTGEVEIFDNSACEFGYRDSIFKNEMKDSFIITHVTLRLNKTPRFNTSYGAIEQELEAQGASELSIKAISDAVVAIRQSKLPDPVEIGNAGSFFKNPIIPTEQFERLQKAYGDMVGHPDTGGTTKVAAGWLIERAGWKGKTFGNYGVHKNQALVLVNYNDATGKQIYDLSQEILESVQEKFGITMEREVNII